MFPATKVSLSNHLDLKLLISVSVEHRFFLDIIEGVQALKLQQINYLSPSMVN